MPSDAVAALTNDSAAFSYFCSVDDAQLICEMGMCGDAIFRTQLNHIIFDFLYFSYHSIGRWGNYVHAIIIHLDLNNIGNMTI